MRRAALANIFLLLAAFAIHAETLTPTLEKSTLFFGEPVTLLIPVAPGETLRATVKEEDKNFAVIRTEPADGKIRIVLSALETGSFTTPPLILFVDGRSYEIAPVAVTVTPNTTEADTSLRDIKPPVKAFETDYTLLWVLGAITVVALLLFLFWRLSKRRRREATISASEKTPYQVALEYRRRAEQQLQEMDYEAFADTVTAGLRHYLELVKHRPFLEMTTGEIRRVLKKTDISAEEAERIVAFLSDADRFKYADEPLSSDRFSALLDEFSRIVDKIERTRSVSTLPGNG